MTGLFAKQLSFLVVCISILLQSCATPYSPPEIDSRGNFHGLEHYLENTENDHYIVIAIHGMCHHDKSWADKKAVQIADLMKMEIDYPDSSSDNPQTLISTTPQGIVGYRADLSRPDDGKRISLYSIIFSSPSDKAKKSLCSDVSKPTLVCSEDDLSYSKDRAKINLELKDNLLNDCLADASYYLGNL